MQERDSQVEHRTKQSCGHVEKRCLYLCWLQKGMYLLALNAFSFFFFFFYHTQPLIHLNPVETSICKLKDLSVMNRTLLLL